MDDRPTTPTPQSDRAEPDAGGDPPPARAHRWFEIALLVLIVGTIGIRFVALLGDPAYSIVTNSGSLLTDEGWYTKSAQLHARFGEWTSAHDPAWLSHNILFTGILAQAFELFGASLAVARAVSICCLAVSLALFYGICRTVQPRAVALAATLLVSITLHNFMYSRMALVEPMATMFSLAAIWCWVRMPRSLAGSALALLFAVAAFLSKATFAYTIGAIVVLVAVDLWARFEETSRRRAIGIGAAVVVAGALGLWLLYHQVVDAAGADGAFFAMFHIAPRLEALELREVPLRETKMLVALAYRSGAPALSGLLAFGVIALRIKRRLGLRTRPSRATGAMLVWCICGWGFLGMFDYRPPRYVYFALFPIVYGAVLATGRLVRDRHWRMASLMLLLVHGATQLPGYVEWTSRTPHDTAVRLANDVSERIEFDHPGDEPVAVMGGLSSFISFANPRVRPIGFKWVDDLPASVAHWRPAYLIALPDEAPELRKRCPRLIAGIELLAEYRVMENYYRDSDHALYRIRYRD